MFPPAATDLDPVDPAGRPADGGPGPVRRPPGPQPPEVDHRLPVDGRDRDRHLQVVAVAGDVDGEIGTVELDRLRLRGAELPRDRTRGRSVRRPDGDLPQRGGVHGQADDRVVPAAGDLRDRHRPVAARVGRANGGEQLPPGDRLDGEHPLGAGAEPGLRVAPADPGVDRAARIPGDRRGRHEQREQSGRAGPPGQLQPGQRGTETPAAQRSGGGPADHRQQRPGQQQGQDEQHERRREETDSGQRALRQVELAAGEQGEHEQHRLAERDPAGAGRRDPPEQPGHRAGELAALGGDRGEQRDQGGDRGVPQRGPVGGLADAGEPDRGHHVDQHLPGEATGDRTGQHGDDALPRGQPPARPPAGPAQRDHGQLALPALGAVAHGQVDAEAGEQHQRHGQHRDQQPGRRPALVDPVQQARDVGVDLQGGVEFGGRVVQLLELGAEPGQPVHVEGPRGG